PATSAITITNTHTTSAIPPPVIAVDTRRTSSERTLYFSGIAISRNRPQRINNIPPRRRTRRHHRTEQPNQRRHHQRLGQDHRRHPDRSERSAHVADRECLQHDVRRAAPDNPAYKSNQDRLSQQQRQNRPRRKSHRAHHRDLAAPLAYRHRRRIGRHQPYRQHHDKTENFGHPEKRAVLLHEAADKCRLGLRDRLRRRVGKAFINRSDHLRHI